MMPAASSTPNWHPVITWRTMSQLALELVLGVSWHPSIQRQCEPNRPYLILAPPLTD